MRELRKDIKMTLESKEEIDNGDEVKIEDVLMGLKGLRQEEVFSFLGKNNFTPTETEEWLKMISSTGFSGYDQLSPVDPTEMEQLQLSFNAHFDGLQGSNGHSVLNNSYISKCSNTDLKFKIKCDINTSTSKSYNSPFLNVSRTNSDNIYDWTTKKDRNDDIQHHQRIPSMWPKYPGTHEYSLNDYHVENYREEEIVTTNMEEELISSSNTEYEDEFKYSPNNTYIIQSFVDGTDMPDKSKPIKLRIKRVESEDEVSAGTLRDIDSPVTRTRSRRTWNSSVKRKTDRISCSNKRKCLEKKCHKSKVKPDISVTKKDIESSEELDFPFSNTVHQDDDFVYPSLDLSDDEEEDIYNFSQRDDETWTPKIKMKINEVKAERPIRNRKCNAVAKCLEAAALKHADLDTSDKINIQKVNSKYSKRKTVSLSEQDTADNRSDYMYDDLNFSKSNIDNTYSLPSTSDDFFSTPSSSYCTLNTFSSPSEMSIAETTISSELPKSSSSVVRKGRKSRTKSSLQSRKIHLKSDSNESKLVSPKTCKLIQTVPNSAVSHLPQSPASKRVKNESSSNSSSYAICTGEKKISISPYITKRGKPRKGMATAKQRLGKILKMHKMFF